MTWEKQNFKSESTQACIGHDVRYFGVLYEWSQDENFNVFQNDNS